MTELKYLESKGIKDNPRIIDSSGQATDFYLQDLLEDYTKQLTLTDVSTRQLPSWVRPLITIITMSLVTVYLIYKTFYVC
tara:strand:+ start:11628 stop:11867 length:240 start_codon:yes stop_codon:yes gene_type:complete